MEAQIALMLWVLMTVPRNVGREGGWFAQFGWSLREVLLYRYRNVVRNGPSTSSLAERVLSDAGMNLKTRALLRNNRSRFRSPGSVDSMRIL